MGYYKRDLFQHTRLRPDQSTHNKQIISGLEWKPLHRVKNKQVKLSKPEIVSRGLFNISVEGY